MNPRRHENPPKWPNHDWFFFSTEHPTINHHCKSIWREHQETRDWKAHVIWTIIFFRWMRFSISIKFKSSEWAYSSDERFFQHQSDPHHPSPLILNDPPCPPIKPPSLARPSSPFPQRPSLPTNQAPITRPPNPEQRNESRRDDAQRNGKEKAKKNSWSLIVNPPWNQHIHTYIPESVTRSWPRGTYVTTHARSKPPPPPQESNDNKPHQSTRSRGYTGCSDWWLSIIRMKCIIQAPTKINRWDTYPTQLIDRMYDFVFFCFFPGRNVINT